MDEFAAFKCFSNLIITNNFVNICYTFNDHKVILKKLKYIFNQIKKYIEYFEHLLNKNSPKLIKVLKKNQISTDLFFIDWYFTLFARAFDLDLIAKFWDLLFIFGLEYSMYTMSLVIMELVETEINESIAEDKLLSLIKEYTWKIDPKVLFTRFFEIKITNKDFYYELNSFINNNN